MGRCLLQVGEKFLLLPFRHVPIEPAYESSFQVVPSAEESANDVTLQFCSDGSHKAGIGAGAVVVLAPYAHLQSAVIAQFKVQGHCTSTKAEIRSATSSSK